MRYHGANDDIGSIGLRIPDHGVPSAIDWVAIGRLPYRHMARYNAEGAIRSLREIESMPWDVAAPGHADLGDKRALGVTRRYLETVRDGVVEGIASKQPIEQIVPPLRAKLAADSDFSRLKEFDEWVELNIRGIHDQIARAEGRMDG